MAEYLNIKYKSNVDKNVPTKETFEAALPINEMINLSNASWVKNLQTVTVNGILADESQQIIIVVPNNDSKNTYYSCGVDCVAQAENQLTFNCKTVPESDLSVYVNTIPINRN